MKINSISPEKEVFFQRLATIAKPPKCLYYVGTPPDRQRKAVAIVGSRNPTAYGRAVAQRLASVLAERGVIIVSGLAHGIDGAAHKATLEAGGTAVAVLAGGLDEIYPRAHTAVAREIVQRGGMVMSEYEPGTPPLQFRFLERNRLVSGLADAVVVVEAAAKSGTLHTVGFALEQGVSVYAVPGNITSPLSSGCNMLIQQGATPLWSIESFISELGLQNAAAPHRVPMGESAEQHIVLQLLATGLTDADELLAKSELAAESFATTLTLLELRGHIRPLGGNHWTLAS